jgi:hypothetical protein
MSDDADQDVITQWVPVHIILVYNSYETSGTGPWILGKVHTLPSRNCTVSLYCDTTKHDTWMDGMEALHARVWTRSELD